MPSVYKTVRQVEKIIYNGKFADQMLRAGLIQEHDLQPYKEYLNNVKRG